VVAFSARADAGRARRHARSPRLNRRWRPRLRIDYPGFYRPVYGDLNAERAEAYHRLDVRLERPIRIARVDGLFYIDIITAYGRRNTGAAGYEPVAGSAEYRLVEKEGLPLLASLGVKLVL
jgi:hypothetical protein